MCLLPSQNGVALKAEVHWQLALDDHDLILLYIVLGSSEFRPPFLEGETLTWPV